MVLIYGRVAFVRVPQEGRKRHHCNDWQLQRDTNDSRMQLPSVSVVDIYMTIVRESLCTLTNATLPYLRKRRSRQIETLG